MHPVAAESGSPLVRKLGIKPDARVAILSAPNGFVGTLAELPSGVRVLARARAPIDVAVAFFTRRHELARRAPQLTRALAADGALWIAWPKRTSGVVTDLRAGVVREVADGVGLVDQRLVALDDMWSAIAFVARPSDGMRRRRA